MDAYRLIEIQNLIHQQITSHEALNERLFKAEALMQLAIASPLDQLAHTTIYHYLWTLDELVLRARELGEQSLDLSLRLSAYVGYLDTAKAS